MVDMTHFQRAVEKLRIENLKATQDDPMVESTLSEKERLRILRTYCPEFKREREIWLDDVVSMTRDFNRNDVQEVVSLAYV